MKKKRIVISCLAVLITLLCVWRLWPHSLNNILDINGEVFDAVTASVSEFGVSNGAPSIDVYRLDISSQEDSNYEPLMEILQKAEFRSDFRNFLPWDILTVSSGQDNITHSAYIMLKWEGVDDFCYITFHGNRIVSFDISGKNEYLIYHPVNRKMLNEIVTYIKENGTLQQ